MSKNETQYDVIVWGASGFTGRLVAEYLNNQYGQSGDVRWAMGGRSESKLKAVAAEIGAEGVAIVTGDASDPASLRAIAAQTKVICTTVGPYQLYGSEMVAACVEAGTDYVDLCGEPNWMRQMIDQHHEKARETGARIVHSCGFDSIPFDLGVFFLQQSAKEKFGVPCVEIKGRVKAIKGKASGGTVASMIATIEAGGKDPMVRKVMSNPYSLAPDESVKRPRQPDGRRPRYDHDARAWVAPFIMADINTRNVHRSNMLMNYAYGENFKYSEMMMTKSGIGANVAAGGMGIFAAALMASPTRMLLKNFVLPKPGDGPNANERETGFYDVRFFGKTEAGDVVRAKVTGDRDPGYGSTSKMLGESAVVLAEDVSNEAVSGGVTTASASMGEVLIDRLKENAGLTFEIL